MAAAEVGDDVFRDDPTVLDLERRMAELTGDVIEGILQKFPVSYVSISQGKSFLVYCK